MEEIQWARNRNDYYKNWTVRKKYITTCFIKHACFYLHSINHSWCLLETKLWAEASFSNGSLPNTLQSSHLARGPSWPNIVIKISLIFSALTSDSFPIRLKCCNEIDGAGSSYSAVCWSLQLRHSGVKFMMWEGAGGPNSFGDDLLLNLLCMALFMCDT